MILNSEPNLNPRKSWVWIGPMRFLVVVFIMGLGSCSMVTEQKNNSVAFTNNSSYSLEIYPASGQPFARFTLEPSSSKSIEIGTPIGINEVGFTRSSRVNCTQTTSSFIFSNLQATNVSFHNNTQWTLQVADGENDNFDTFSLLPGAFKSSSSTGVHDTYVISGQGGTKAIHTSRINNYVGIYQYDNIVEYSVEGTATNADITFENSLGVKETHTAVALPVTYALNTKTVSSAFVSANTNGSGSVTVKIVARGVDSGTATSTGIATAECTW